MSKALVSTVVSTLAAAVIPVPGGATSVGQVIQTRDNQGEIRGSARYCQLRERTYRPPPRLFRRTAQVPCARKSDGIRSTLIAARVARGSPSLAPPGAQRIGALVAGFLPK